MLYTFLFLLANRLVLITTNRVTLQYPYNNIYSVIDGFLFIIDSLRMPNLSKLARIPDSKIPLSILAGFTGTGVLLYLTNRIFNGTTPRSGDLGIKLSSPKRTEKVSVDLKFIKNVLMLLRIAVPKVFCMEMFYLVLVAIGLIARTYSDLWIITNGTAIESSIIDRNPVRMWKHVSLYIFWFNGLRLIIALTVLKLIRLFEYIRI